MVFILEGIEKSLTSGVEVAQKSTQRLQAMLEQRQQQLETLASRIGTSAQ